MAGHPLLHLQGLGIRFGARAIVEDVTFVLAPGEVLGLVGESGSGKTTIALALLGHRPWGATVAGKAWLQGQDMLSLKGPALQAVRGRRIAYVPQNPTTALNPARRIGALMVEHLVVHGLTDPVSAYDRACVALQDVGLEDAERVLASYPHQLSGGQQQRVVLALSTLSAPEVLVLDEPTTGLDVTTQAVVIAHLRSLRDVRQQAMVYVTHDLDLLAGIATHLAVLYAGRIMEHGPADRIFAAPAHPYTRALLAATPSLRRPDQRARGIPGTLDRDTLGTGCPFAPRCPVSAADCTVHLPPLTKIAPGHSAACLHLSAPFPPDPETIANGRSDMEGSPTVLTVQGLSVSYSAPLFGRRRSASPALSGAILTLARGEILAVVGESGSGKSTLAKAIAGLLPGYSGSIALDGKSLAPAVSYRSQEQRRQVQFVFQNPDASLNPRRSVAQILADALRAARPGLATMARSGAIKAALAEVRLPEVHANRFPDQLSGGERQRVALARALIANPEVLICDEVLSALDVSVQAGIVTLLRRLCRERNLAILFISHDLAVVRQLAQRVVVMYRGHVLAQCNSDRLAEPLQHPYVSQLLLAAQGMQTNAAGALPTGTGCPFYAACPLRIPGLCDTTLPPWTEGPDRFRCHQPGHVLVQASGWACDARV